jgi:hypothetical protein
MTRRQYRELGLIALAQQTTDEFPIKLDLDEDYENQLSQ